jgi:hypothetical protein
MRPPETKKAAVVSQGGLCRTIGNDSPLAAPPLVALLKLGRVIIGPGAVATIDVTIGRKQIPATRRWRGPYRFCCLLDDQHDFAKVNAVVFTVKCFFTIVCSA